MSAPVLPPPAALPERGAVDRATFEAEILPRAEPVVLRGQVQAWPLVREALKGPAALAAAVRALDNGTPVDALLLEPRHQGRVFYGDDFQGFNFLRNQLPLTQVLEQALRYAQFPVAPAVAVQSAAAERCAPAFTVSHAMPLLDANVLPRLWLGTAIVTPAHFDESHNIACVVAGRRRFTLFPPDQIGNLSIGPIGNAPTGTPISLVDFAAPDLARHPRFATAWAHARAAELAPGDALYIPPLWWHHVASLASLNLLVNYWWKQPAHAPSALDALLHTLLALGELPPAQRQAWQALFAHWVFGSEAERLGHLPAALQGVHGAMGPALREQVRRFLAERLRDVNGA